MSRAFRSLVAPLFAFGLAACGGAAVPAPAPPAAAAATATPASEPDETLRPACTEAIGKAAATGRADEEPDDKARAAEQAMSESCVATRWSREMLLCLSNGTTRDELSSCPELLTEDQFAEMLERLTAAGLLNRDDAVPPPPS